MDDGDLIAPTEEAAPAGMSSTTRLEAFSDGVIAIAITLLVLEITVPEAERGQLAHELGRLWPSYAAYAVSFLTIGIVWMNHHLIFSLVRGVDRGLMYRNLLLLGTVSFIPFPTSVLADHLRDGGNDARVAVGLYGFVMVVLGVEFTALWAHLHLHPEVLRPAVTTRVQSGLRHSTLGATGYLVATLTAFAAPWLSVVLYALLSASFAVLRRPAEG